MKTNLKAGVKDGLSSAEPLGQKELRGETGNGPDGNKLSQRPTKSKSTVSSDRGKFTLY